MLICLRSLMLRLFCEYRLQSFVRKIILKRILKQAVCHQPIRTYDDNHIVIVNMINMMIIITIKMSSEICRSPLGNHLHFSLKFLVTRGGRVLTSQLSPREIKSSAPKLCKLVLGPSTPWQCWNLMLSQYSNSGPSDYWLHCWRYTIWNFSKLEWLKQHL